MLWIRDLSYRSGSADLCLGLVDPNPAPDPASVVLDLQDANKNYFLKVFLLTGIFFLKVHLHHLFYSNIKRHKVVFA